MSSFLKFVQKKHSYVSSSRAGFTFDLVIIWNRFESGFQNRCFLLWASPANQERYVSLR